MRQAICTESSIYLLAQKCLLSSGWTQTPALKDGHEDRWLNPLGQTRRSPFVDFLRENPTLKIIFERYLEQNGWTPPREGDRGAWISPGYGFNGQPINPNETDINRLLHSAPLTRACRMQFLREALPLIPPGGPLASALFGPSPRWIRTYVFLFDDANFARARYI